jgi:hypothetical protein
MKRSIAKRKGYTAKDLRAVSDNPEWTESDFARAKPFKKVFAGVRKARNKALIKKR